MRVAAAFRWHTALLLEEHSPMLGRWISPQSLCGKVNGNNSHELLIYAQHHSRLVHSVTVTPRRDTILQPGRLVPLPAYHYRHDHLTV